MEELFNGEKVIEEFETMTMDAKRVERETLKKILEENESAEYLINLNLNGRTDPQSFKTCVPVVSHEDIESYILRIANKEDNSDILTAKPFSSITTSSGTTQGKKKLIPFNEQYLEAKCKIVKTYFAYRNRYRLGDVVKVMEFHNSTPKLKFMSRKNVLLSINTEKTTEKDLQIVVEEACKLLPTDDIKLELIDFTSYADSSTAPAHYVIFWELSCDYEKVINYDDIICECCNCMDKSLIDYGYTLGRNSNNIGPLELCIVKTGTFQKIQDHTVTSGTSISQFKSPRCVSSTNHGVLEILYNNAVKSYYITAF